MEISITEVSGDNIELTVDGVSGVNSVLTIEGTVDPGQSYRAPSMKDEVGQEGFDASFEINEVSVFVTDSYQLCIPLSQVNDQLMAAGFYRAVIDEIKDYCQS